jgi:hypothetical protein
MITEGANSDIIKAHKDLFAIYEDTDTLKPNFKYSPEAIKKTIQDDATLAKNGWCKNGNKYDRYDNKVIKSAIEYLKSERYKSILTNAGVKDADRKEYNNYVGTYFNKWPARNPAGYAQGYDDSVTNSENYSRPRSSNSHKARSASPKATMKTNQQDDDYYVTGGKDVSKLDPNKLKTYNELKAAYDKKANVPHRSEANKLNDFIRQNNLDVPTVESEFDDYIDELESSIYENSMSDYEYHSLVSAIDALF